jgi:tetratricopeptide (TPR) repeat protein
MSSFSWWPGLIVLAVGLAGGLFLALRLRRAGKKAAQEQQARDVDLRIRDLEARRDDLYRRLRNEGPSLTESDRTQLEQAAARVLRELDEITAEVGRGGKSEAKAAASADPARTSDRSRPAPDERMMRSRRSVASGFLLGAGMAAIVGLLIYWAVRDTAGTESPSPGMTQAEPLHPEIQLPGEAQAEYDALRARLAGNPGDTAARKRLAVLLLSQEQYFAAFSEAQTLLEADPDDIDGLYVEAVVRLQMGQIEPARERFDRVIELFPDHVQAHAWKGILLYQTGEVSAAIAAWEQGIEAAGGRHPELEQMVTAALEEEAGLAPLPARVGQQAQTDGPDLAEPSTTAEAGFGLGIEVGEGIQAPNGVLFVALRQSPEAPPIAVRRISSPRFPLQLVLTEGDSMMGAALPESGFITARLDQDGDVSSTQPGDLTADGEATFGGSMTLVLRP